MLSGVFSECPPVFALCEREFRTSRCCFFIARGIAGPLGLGFGGILEVYSSMRGELTSCQVFEDVIYVAILPGCQHSYQMKLNNYIIE